MSLTRQQADESWTRQQADAARNAGTHPAFNGRAPGASRRLLRTADLAASSSAEEVTAADPSLSTTFRALMKRSPDGADVAALDLRSRNLVCTTPVLAGIYVEPSIPEAPGVPAIQALIGAGAVDVHVQLRGSGGLLSLGGEVETFLDTQASADEDYYYSFFPRCHTHHAPGAKRPSVRTAFAAPTGAAAVLVRLREIVPGSTYRARSRLRNAFGWGAWSALSTPFTTNDGFRAMIATTRKFEHLPDLPLHVHTGGRKLATRLSSVFACQYPRIRVQHSEDLTRPEFERCITALSHAVTHHRHASHLQFSASARARAVAGRGGASSDSDDSGSSSDEERPDPDTLAYEAHCEGLRRSARMRDKRAQLAAARGEPPPVEMADDVAASAPPRPDPTAPSTCFFYLAAPSLHLPPLRSPPPPLAATLEGIPVELQAVAHVADAAAARSFLCFADTDAIDEKTFRRTCLSVAQLGALIAAVPAQRKFIVVSCGDVAGGLSKLHKAMHSKFSKTLLPHVAEGAWEALSRAAGAVVLTALKAGHTIETPRKACAAAGKIDPFVERLMRALYPQGSVVAREQAQKRLSKSARARAKASVFDPELTLRAGMGGIGIDQLCDAMCATSAIRSASMQRIRAASLTAQAAADGAVAPASTILDELQGYEPAVYGLRPWLPADVVGADSRGRLELHLDPRCDPRASAMDDVALTFDSSGGIHRVGAAGRLRASAAAARSASAARPSSPRPGAPSSAAATASSDSASAGEIVLIQPQALSWPICCTPKPPPPPSHPSVEARTRSSVTVEWSPSDSPGPPVLGFDVQVRGFGRVNRRWRTLESDTLVTSKCITNLIPGNEYVARFRSRNVAGWSLHSDELAQRFSPVGYIYNRNVDGGAGRAARELAERQRVIQQLDLESCGAGDIVAMMQAAPRDAALQTWALTRLGALLRGPSMIGTPEALSTAIAEADADEAERESERLADERHQMGRGFANAAEAEVAARTNARAAASAATRKERHAMRADRDAEVRAAVPVFGAVLAAMRTFPSDVGVQVGACEAIARLLRFAKRRGAKQHGVSKVTRTKRLKEISYAEEDARRERRAARRERRQLANEAAEVAAEAAAAGAECARELVTEAANEAGLEESSLVLRLTSSRAGTEGGGGESPGTLTDLVAASPTAEDADAVAVVDSKGGSGDDNEEGDGHDDAVAVVAADEGLEDTDDEFQVDEEVTQSDARPKPWRARAYWRKSVRAALADALHAAGADVLVRRVHRRLGHDHSVVAAAVAARSMLTPTWKCRTVHFTIENRTEYDLLSSASASGEGCVLRDELPQVIKRPRQRLGHLGGMLDVHHSLSFTIDDRSNASAPTTESKDAPLSRCDVAFRFDIVKDVMVSETKVSPLPGAADDTSPSPLVEDDSAESKRDLATKRELELALKAGTLPSLKIGCEPLPVGGFRINIELTHYGATRTHRVTVTRGALLRWASEQRVAIVVENFDADADAAARLAAALRLQAAIKSRRALRLIRAMTAMLYRKEWDDAIHSWYYINTRTGATSFAKPATLGDTDLEMAPQF